MLFVGQQQGHSACKFCHNSSKEFTLGTGVTGSNSVKMGKVEQKPSEWARLFFSHQGMHVSIIHHC